MNKTAKTNIKDIKFRKGTIFNNYKELCLYLNEDVKSGNSKVAQIKKWNNDYFEISRIEGTKKYIIGEIKELPPNAKNKKIKYMFYLDRIMLEYEIYKSDDNEFKQYAKRTLVEMMNLLSGLEFRKIYYFRDENMSKQNIYDLCDVAYKAGIMDNITPKHCGLILKYLIYFVGDYLTHNIINTYLRSASETRGLLDMQLCYVNNKFLHNSSVKDIQYEKISINDEMADNEVYFTLNKIHDTLYREQQQHSLKEIKNEVDYKKSSDMSDTEFEKIVSDMFLQSNYVINKNKYFENIVNDDLDDIEWLNQLSDIDKSLFNLYCLDTGQLAEVDLKGKMSYSYKYCYHAKYAYRLANNFQNEMLDNQFPQYYYLRDMPINKVINLFQNEFKNSVKEKCISDKFVSNMITYYTDTNYMDLLTLTSDEYKKKIEKLIEYLF